VTEVGYCTENAAISPVAVFLRHLNNHFLDFGGGAGTAVTALGSAIILVGDQFAVPGQRCVRLNEVGNVIE
jgi:glycerol-3-phosphate acyltransferase PlsY